ncbi:MAG: phosphatidylglycerophosphatase A [Spirochaetota bacterium]
MRLKELLFTGLYTGYSPVMSGTAGTLLAVLIYIIEQQLLGSYGCLANVLIVLVLLYPSFRLAESGESFFGKKDASEIVIDEIIGFWIAMLFLPYNWVMVLMAFVLFRFFDIMKPFPINRLQKLRGGVGIMVDDIVAGIYTNIILWMLVLFAGDALFPF